MKRYIISTGSITYAIKGRDVLRKKGFRARVEKNHFVNQKSGCSYAIILESGNIDDAEKILHNAGVKILSVKEA